MKRKKQAAVAAEDGNVEPTLKRARSGRLVQSDAERADVTEDAKSALPSRQRSQRKDSNEEVQEDIPLGDPNEDAAEDDNAEEPEDEETQDAEQDELGIEPFKGTPKGKTNGSSISSAKKHLVNKTPPRKGLGAKRIFSTPRKVNGPFDDTPKLERHVDRSARRKSTRNLIARTVLGNTSDNEEGDEELEDHIYDSGEEDVEEDAEQDGVQSNGEVTAPETPSKKTGRRNGSKNKQSSPPPTDLPPHELYFSQNRSGRSKTSNNNLSSLRLLDHEEYFMLLRQFKDPHADDIEWLQELHAGSYKQWQFELSQSFNICLFGWGSKKPLLMKFAEFIYKSQKDPTRDKIVVVNGYVQTLTIRDVLNTVASAVSNPAPKLGSQPTDMLENLLRILEDDASRHITIIIHSIDSTSLRRPAAQIILSRLSSHPQIHLVASADHPSFPLLWDSSLRSTYNFLFHDCTTFQPYASELDVVEEVHELLGRSGRRVGGKEGVSFVLKSLPENAKSLFRVLIGEQLAAMDESVAPSFGHDDDEDDENIRNGSGRQEQGVEYRVLYQKAVEEFICSNEMNFRTLLKEFHDHQMIQSRKDALGTEMLSVPFRKEELEMILEDIVS